MLGRVDLVYSRAENAYRPPASFQCSLMRDRVHTAREALIEIYDSLFASIEARMK